MCMELAEARALLGTMWTIRVFEERLAELVASKQVGGLVHVGIGQEATAAGVCAALRDDDYVYTGHRPDGPFIARGADLARMMAELAGRVTGYCRGKGGSMHLVAVERGLLSATGIVGGNLPLGLGSALVCQERGAGQVVAVFFGDGASNAGYFHESLNIAALWRLPIVFVCENNGYAEFTPLSAHTVVERLTVHAERYGIPTMTGDGQNVLEVRDAAAAAVARARAGEGPSFLELETYRLSGHYVGDPQRYREAAELAEWQDKDPIARFGRVLAAEGLADAVDAAGLERDARARVEEAVRYALDSPWPTARDIVTQVLA